MLFFAHHIWRGYSVLHPLIVNYGDAIVPNPVDHSIRSLNTPVQMYYSSSFTSRVSHP